MKFRKGEKYSRDGFVTFARKWTGSELARYPSAFTLYLHLVAWANYKDGALKRGQLALGERDFGVILGMSVITVRKCLRWLRDNGWIAIEARTWGRERGTVITVLHYEASQNKATYDFDSAFQGVSVLPAKSEDQKMILKRCPGGENEDQKMILKSPGEDQQMILNPAFEDQKMIPHILIPRNTTKGAVPERNAPGGPPEGGKKGIGPHGADGIRKRIDSVDSGLSKEPKEREYQLKYAKLKLDLEKERITHRQYFSKIQELRTEYGKNITPEKKKPAVKIGGFDEFSQVQ